MDNSHEWRREGGWHATAGAQLDLNHRCCGYIAWALTIWLPVCSKNQIFNVYKIRTWWDIANLKTFPAVFLAICYPGGFYCGIVIIWTEFCFAAARSEHDWTWFIGWSRREQLRQISKWCHCLSFCLHNDRVCLPFYFHSDIDTHEAQCSISSLAVSHSVTLSQGENEIITCFHTHYSNTSLWDATWFTVFSCFLLYYFQGNI